MNTHSSVAPRPANLTVIGLGPGSPALLTPQALHALTRCQVLVGYNAYVALVDPAVQAGKEIIATGMMGEVERAKAAIATAYSGKDTVVVCSGDPGIYALAGLVLELLEAEGPAGTGINFTVVPGVPAVCAAAALLGAPLMHDFACISLSDLLTPIASIEKRLQAAFAADFVTVLYNPRSKRRQSHLPTALAIAGQHLPANTPVGIARMVARPEQEVRIEPLGAVNIDAIDMFSLLIIGNSQTRIVPGTGPAPLAWAHGARMLTPRGYKEKYAAKM